MSIMFSMCEKRMYVRYKTYITRTGVRCKGEQRKNFRLYFHNTANRINVAEIV